MQPQDQIAFVTGADRGLGLGITTQLLGRGWKVYAGSYLDDWPELGELAAAYEGRLIRVKTDVQSADSVRLAAEQVAASEPRVGMIVNNAGIISPTTYRGIREGQDYDEMHRLFDVNALGAIRVVEAFLPLVEKSEFRRLCFVSSEAGSVGASTRTSWFGYCMSKAALNMAVKNLFNDLRPQGFSFRLYHPGYVRSYMSGEKNVEATLEPEEAGRLAVEYFTGAVESEDDLALVDYEGKRWEW
jgi:NAD(P)-dependent dehydrogenase (short-subunit alcohol dehydrogenase family)